MAETEQELLSTLIRTRLELTESQTRVAELEALLAQDQPHTNTWLDSENYERKRELEEAYSLAKFSSENPNPLMRVARNGTLLYANPSSHRLLALWGCQVGKSVPVDLQHLVSDAFATKMNRDVEVICGDTYYSLTFVPFVDADYGNIYGQDITERKLSEMSLKRYVQRMEILHEVDIGILNATSIETLVESALKHLRQLIPCQRVDVTIMDYMSGEALIFAVGIDGDTALVQGVRVPIPPNVFEGYDARNIRLFDDIRLFQDTMPRARRLVNEGLLCALSAKLMDRDRPIGTLGLFSDTPGFFTSEHVEITVDIANQLAIAIRQLRLSEELAHHATELERNNIVLRQAGISLQRYAQRLEVLREIDIKIIGAGSLQSLLEIIVKHFRTLVPCPRVAAALIDQATGEAVIYAVDLNSPSAIGEGVRTPLPADWFDGFDADNTRVIDDFRSLSDPLPVYKQLIEEGIVTSLHVLLMDREHPIGIFGLSAATPGFFTAEHRKIASEIANQIAIAIRQLNLIEELARHAAELERNNIVLQQAGISLQRYAQRLEILHEIDLGLIQGDSIQTLVEVVLKHIRQLIPCQRVSASLIDETKGEMLVFAVDLNRPSEVHEGIRVTLPSNWLDGYDTDHTKTIDDIRLEGDLIPAQKQLLKEGLVTFLHVLLVVQGHPIGLLAMSTDTPGFFTAEYREVAIEIARQLAIAIRQLNLTEELAHHAAELEQKVADRTADLNDAKERVEAILNNSTDGIMLVHPDLSIQQVNSSFNSLFACEPDDYFGKSLVSLVQADEVDRVTRMLQAAGAEKQAMSIEIRTVRKDGKVFDAELTIGYIKDDGLVCTFRDISERRHVQEALRASEERFRLLMDAAPIATVITDQLGIVTLVNIQAEALFGYNRTELVGQSVEVLIPERFRDVHPQHRADYMAAPRVRQMGIGLELLAKRKDGSEFPVEIELSHIETQPGLLVMSFIVDITVRKAQELQLRYYASLQESVVDSVIVTDVEFRIQTWNSGAERIYGWTSDEVIGKSAPELLQIRRSSAEDSESTIQRLNEQGFIQQESLQRRKDGSDIYILGSATLLTDQNGKAVGVISVNRDITEQKALNRQLRYQAVLQENVSEAVIVTDMEFRIQSWNRAAERIYGWSAEDIVGKESVQILRTQFVTAGGMEQSQQLLREQGWWQGEVIQQHKDGRSIHILGSVTLVKDETGTPFGVISVNRDITERNKAEEALRTSEKRFSILVNGVHDYAIYMLDNIGTVMSWNVGAERIEGYNAEEIIGQNFERFFTPESIAQGEPQMVLKTAEQVGHVAGVGWRVRKDGSQFWAEIIVTALRNDKNDLIGFSKLTRDLTEHRQTEQALQKALEKEKELNELKSRFVSMASHEFRTPLASILAVTETLSAYRQRMPDEQIDQRLGKIRDQVDHLKNIMDDMLQLAQLQARRNNFNPSRTNLDAVCRSILDEFQSRPDITHQLLYTCDDPQREVKVDKKLIRQIISNLMSNAIKYSPKENTVTLSLEYIGDALAIKVRDEGIGIPEADLKHLFEPFHRASNVGTISGTGLGLVIAKESVELHGGEIAVESQVGVGTTFTVTIPRIIEEGNRHGENTGN